MNYAEWVGNIMHICYYCNYYVLFTKCKLISETCVGLRGLLRAWRDTALRACGLTLP